MGFREFAKDYKIEFVDRPGRKRPKAVRVYIGAWYRFKAPEKIPFMKWFYLVGLAVIAATTLVQMGIDCSFTRKWYVQIPAVTAWIPWVFAACATWRLWTAKEKVDREHKSMLSDRMNGSSLFLMMFTVASFLGCVFETATNAAQLIDIVVTGCSMISGVTAIALFSKRKSLEMEITEK